VQESPGNKPSQLDASTPSSKLGRIQLISAFLLVVLVSDVVVTAVRELDVVCVAVVLKRSSSGLGLSAVNTSALLLGESLEACALVVAVARFPLLRCSQHHTTPLTNAMASGGRSVGSDRDPRALHD